MSQPKPLNPTRRQILAGSTAGLIGSSLSAGALAGTASATQPIRSRAKENETIRVALVGCGGRGTGAAIQALSTEGPVELVAMADAFSDRLEGSLNEIKKHNSERVNVPESRRFVGFDAYKEAIACATDDGPIDVVILTTPPGFRPIHFEHAIASDKHVFMEKPVAVDGSGIRRVLAAGAEAKRKELKVGVGLQRHHEAKYMEGVKRVQDGAIGDITLLRCYWNSGGVWVRERQAGMTEMEYQMRNWYYFNWLCGDHIVEQHIHNLDVCNWVMDGFPVKAQGLGGRQVRTGINHGEIFDHHAVEFTYANGTKMMSQCSHLPGAWSSVSEHAHGTHGSASFSQGRIKSQGGWDWRFREENPNPYQVEHDDLFRAIREGNAYSEVEYGAKSTMTAILGRMATYSGKEIKFDDALNSEVALTPSKYTWDGTPPTTPDADGRYVIPMPGRTRVL
ncbi:MAG: myo-inositol 2-dehydrogenase/D-chiro-inositol 1-dehydrogenase [Planctomycetota bacterium]|jgi:myo-inositol 2-dehydrogenase/D-chiro-inositol 1-dehydrogenase